MGAKKAYQRVGRRRRSKTKKKKKKKAMDATQLLQVASKKGGNKTSEKMLKAMKKRYLRWKKRKENQKDWSKVTWTPAQVRGSKRTAKAADKAETAEVVSDYVAEKAEKGERIRKGKAMR